MAKTEGYNINGKMYSVTAGETYQDKNGNLVQPITINGQKIELKVEDAKDEFGKKTGKKIIALYSLVPETKDYVLEKSEILDVLEARVNDKKNVTQLEKLAVYEYEYNRCSQAKYIVDNKPEGRAEEKNYRKEFTDEEISGKKKLKPVAELYPWAYTSTDDNIADHGKALTDKDAKKRVEYRKALKEVDNIDRDMFDDIIPSGGRPWNPGTKGKTEFYDDLAQALKNDEKLKTLKGNKDKTDESTDRLMARVEERKSSKKTPSYTTNNNRNVDRA